MSRPRRPAAVVVRFLAGLASLSAFFYYYGHAQVLLYGDAVAHINIARRAFDSRTPGPLQLGTVWLPLPHLVIMPFVVSDAAWQSGLLASLPSMLAYVLAVLGVFRLLRDSLPASAGGAKARDMAAIFGAAVFGANPNLLYLQATAMTEALYLALFVWSVVYAGDCLRALSSDELEGAGKPLLHCCLCLAGAMLTRYDGWFSAGVIVFILLLVGARRLRALRTARSATQAFAAARLLKAMALAVLIVVAVPALWMTYNAVVFGNPLNFLNGPYSARGIAQRTSPGNFHHPGYHDLWVALLYYVKAVELNLANGWWEKIWLLAAAGGAFIGLRSLRMRPLVLLWVPVPFYVLSIAYGDVPIFVPQWWPQSYYNLRYGLELLPAVGVFSAIALYAALSSRNLTSRWTMVIAACAFIFAALSYAGIWRAQPICLQEAVVNSRTRVPFETELAAQLDRLPPSATILMYIGDHVGALQRAGIPLRRIIHEGNHGDWKHALAKTGLWEQALAQPERMADYAVAFDDDAVSHSAHEHHLTAVVVVETLGQPRATIYQTHPWPR